MIISASRRTDLPALYAPWFLRRVREGWCSVPNPFNLRQVKRISLRPEKVDALVFWSRWPAPLLPALAELRHRGLGRSLFLITLLHYPRILEPQQPPLQKRLQAFRDLAGQVGTERTVWRYDPILLTPATPPIWHVQTFTRLARALKGHTKRCIVSFMDDYAKIRPRMKRLYCHGFGPPPLKQGTLRRAELLARLADIARNHGMALQTCAQDADLVGGLVPAGACIDADLLHRLFGTPRPARADPNQRENCLCAPSQDIGMYDSCTFGCAYCYATRHFRRSRANRAAHDPDSPSLLGHHIPAPAQAVLPGC
jgi:hypothetical protein